jgi:hypothetical protein
MPTHVSAVSRMNLKAKVFAPPVPEGHRLIVVETNIAEASVT